MKIKKHIINNILIEEVYSDRFIFGNISSTTDLLGKLYYEGYHGLIIYKDTISPDFFELKNGMAGEILQKFSNFKMQLLIVGDFSTNSSRSLNDFIFECNKGKQVNFTISLQNALTILSKRFKG